MGQLVAGSAVVYPFRLELAAGGIDSGEAANLSVVAHLDGAAISLGESFAEIGTTGYYTLSFTAPASTGYLRVQILHSGTSIPVSDILSGPLMAYDTDDLVAELQQSSGNIAPLTADDGDLGDVVEGDAWNSGVLTIPLAKISPLGYSDLTGMTISAAAMDAVDGTPVLVTASIVNASARTVRFGWSGASSFPAAMVLPAGDTQKDWFFDVQLKHTADSNIITGARYKLRVVWERNTVT